MNLLQLLNDFKRVKMFAELQELSASHDGSVNSFNNTDDIEVIDATNEVSQPTLDDEVVTTEYITDSTVPPGWSYKGELAQGKHFRLRPRGCPTGRKE